MANASLPCKETRLGQKVTDVLKKCGLEARRPGQRPRPRSPLASIRVLCFYARQVVSESVSRCGTRKLLIRLEDGLDVETVVIPCLTGTRWASLRVLPREAVSVPGSAERMVSGHSAILPTPSCVNALVNNGIHACSTCRRSPTSLEE